MTQWKLSVRQKPELLKTNSANCNMSTTTACTLLCNSTLPVHIHQGVTYLQQRFRQKQIDNTLKQELSVHPTAAALHYILLFLWWRSLMCRIRTRGGREGWQTERENKKQSAAEKLRGHREIHPISWEGNWEERDERTRKEKFLQKTWFTRIQRSMPNPQVSSDDSYYVVFFTLQRSCLFNMT